jgi:hypothetical protein
MKLPTNELLFMKGENGANPYSQVLAIEMWNKPLTDKQMMKYNQCNLAEQSAQCTDTYTYSPSVKMYRASGVYAGYGLQSRRHSYWSNPSLDTPRQSRHHAWCLHPKP